MKSMNSTRCLVCQKYKGQTAYQCKNSHYIHDLCHVCQGIYPKCMQCDARLVKVQLTDSKVQVKINHFKSSLTSTQQSREPAFTAKTTDNVARKFKSIDSYKDNKFAKY